MTYPRQRGSRKLSKIPPMHSFVSSVVMVLFLTGCTIGGEPKHPTWRGATGAEQYERLVWQSIHDKDWKEIEYRLAPTFIGVNAQGQALDRAAWIEYWKSFSLQEFSLGEVAVQPEGADMVLTYVLQVSGSQAQSFRVVSVWQQVKRGWILTANSTTPVISH